MDLSTLLSIMHRQLQQEAPEEEILEALRMADKEQKCFILVSELTAKLTRLGEKLTDEEGESVNNHPKLILKIVLSDKIHFLAIFVLNIR